ncbi:MAG: hypothetical protein HUJ26_18860 [Planctomycetaceae bacterium]|nr:hypothetical protein [Planctomycetaceae bacterium]
MPSDLFREFIQWHLENVPRAASINMKTGESESREQTTGDILDNVNGLRDMACPFSMEQLDEVFQEADEYPEDTQLSSLVKE